FTGNRWTLNKVFTLADILTRIAEQYEAFPVEGSPNDTARHYMIPGHEGSFSVISTMSAPFCSTCNRMRLTADGKLKNCLFSSGETDLLSALRTGKPVTPLIYETISQKAKALGGQFANTMEQLDADNIHNRAMIGIGG
ncbi:MAG: cyclic pyranopterin phosphate synthase MoaA, partial [Chitinophagaceae bacterium]|nr:cyclic pyranopterin phosphate synthase MoaA [Chitinophagaceae bacterium]